ncbi:hypothetical protein [Fluviicola taffensis]|uniref:Lipoprotein n=1 Tax=Fluviicola taffensis (strain DSM 16823 / NCIMB 13979 / RW262) TaxID=755732 RepID=F2ICL1_FLUTR|nr:hypothetical protein [Fluviicola taffensis]AEA42238.1 hypothetical protein Fluta_0229 [Fluviicola taffensis DSM 16823]
MRKILVFGLLSCLIINSSCSNIEANDADYDALAQDMCECASPHTSKISKEMRQAMITSEKEGTNVQAAMNAVFVKDPKSGVADMHAIDELGIELKKCSERLNSKYSAVYTNESEEDVIQKLLNALKKRRGCEFTYALMKATSKPAK